MKLERRSSFGWPATAAKSAHPTKGLVVHFDGNDQHLEGREHEACRSYWKATRKFHMGPDRRWLDIGYSLAVCVHGIVLEGRGLDHVQAAQPGGNQTWYSCTFMSGPDEKPTEAQLKAFAELRAFLRGKGLASAIKGHRQFVSTDCPGDILFAMVKSGTFTAFMAGPSAHRLLRSQNPHLTGEDVRRVQRALNTFGAQPLLDVDGDYGPATEKAVKEFQKAHHLDQDGVSGPKTRAALKITN